MFAVSHETVPDALVYDKYAVLLNTILWVYFWPYTQIFFHTEADIFQFKR